VGNARARIDSHEGKKSDTCSLCGAWKGQLGGEPEPDLYISHLIQIMREVRRVLRPDGVFWINIGDSWGANWRGSGKDNASAKQLSVRGTSDFMGQQTKHPYKPLDMVLIPSQLAIAARTDGWYVRSMVVWDKKNPMPESLNGWRWERHKVKVRPRTRGSNKGSMPPQSHHAGQVPHRDGSFDTPSDTIWQDCPGCPKCSPNDGYVLRKGSWRPTDSYEFILMLTKTNHYFCDRESVLEQGVYPTGESRQGGDGHKSLNAGSRTTEGLHNKEWVGNGGRNLRSVWSFPTKPGKFNHYAVYPPRLPEICLKSSTSEKGCCPKCGSPWARVIEHHLENTDGWGKQTKDATGNLQGSDAVIRNAQGRAGDSVNRTLGWRPTCSCPPADPTPCRVLDPFSGAGTTALVAEQLGLDSISIDTSGEYIQMSRDRLVADEQKRIDEFVKQAKRAAKQYSNNGHKSVTALKLTTESTTKSTTEEVMPAKSNR